MTRQAIKTATGYTIYGAFTCTMRLDSLGNVTYCNMKPDSQEYQAMYRTYQQTI